MTKKEHLPFDGQPSSSDIYSLLLSGGIDLAIINICSQASSVKLGKDGVSLYEENGLDYNSGYIVGLRVDLQTFAEQVGATIVSQQAIHLGNETQVIVPTSEGHPLHFTLTKKGINNKFNLLIIARK